MYFPFAKQLGNPVQCLVLAFVVLGISEISATEPPGTWTDPVTGLTWAKADSGIAADWETSTRYCRQLRLEGHSDWVLPSVSELASIYDPSINTPDKCCSARSGQREQINWHFKGGMKTYGYLWTSTQSADRDQAAAMAFAEMGGSSDLHSAFRLWDLISDSQAGALCVRHPNSFSERSVKEIPLGQWVLPTKPPNVPKMNIPVDVSITPYIKRGLQASAFTARSSTVDLNDDGISEVSSMLGCGASGCQMELVDGATHKKLLSFGSSDTMHVLPARTQGYHDLFEDGGSRLFVLKINGEQYEPTECYQWLNSLGSVVSEAEAGVTREKLKSIPCKASNNSQIAGSAAKDEQWRKSFALSLGLHSGQTLTQVKAKLASHGYRPSTNLRPGTPTSGPWSCYNVGASMGEAGTTINLPTITCSSQKGDVDVELRFVERVRPNHVTGIAERGPVADLTVASFNFHQFSSPDNFIVLMVAEGCRSNGSASAHWCIAF